jgi:glucose-6-phosphate 1-dehydrogenase
VAPNSEVETFAAVRLAVENWRWQGVPVFIRAGKALATTCTEVLARLRRPPPILRDEPTQNYLRFRINPWCEIALGLTVMDSEGAGNGEKVELLASRFDAGRERDAYERVLSDALAGDRTLFAREDYMEEAWRIVDPVLKADTAIYPYEPGGWGAKQGTEIAPIGGWWDPVAPAGPAQ